MGRTEAFSRYVNDYLAKVYVRYTKMLLKVDWFGYMEFDDIFKGFFRLVFLI